MPNRVKLLILAGTVAAAAARIAFGDQSEPLAVLHQHCAQCHSAAKRKGGLRIDSRESLLKGGESGAAIAPGNAKNSFLLETLYPDAETHMPPKGQLSPREISVLEDWIAAGAKWDAARWEKLTRPAKVKVTLKSLPEAYAPVLALAIAPGGKMIAAGFRDRVEIFDIGFSDEKKKTLGATKKAELRGHSDAVQSLVFSPDAKRIASGSFQRLLIQEVGNSDAQNPVRIEEPFYGRLTALAFSPDGASLYVADSLPARGAFLHLVNSKTGQIIKTLPAAHDDAIYALALTADGKKLVTASADKLAIVRDAASLERLTVLEGHTGYVLSAVFSPEGGRVATGGDDAVIKVWDAATGTQLASFATAKSGPVGGLAWVTDPERAARRTAEKDPEKAKAINTDRIVSINDLGQPGTFTDLVTHEGGERSAGAREQRHEGTGEGLTAMALDPETLILFSGSEKGRIYAWDKQGKKAGQWDLPGPDSTAPRPSP